MFAVSSLNKGFRLYNAHTLDIVAFADDALLLAPSADAMSSLLTTAITTLGELGLILNVKKCTSLSVSYAHSINKLANVFSVCNVPIPIADTPQVIRYLGRPYYAIFYTDTRTYIKDILTLARTIGYSDLFPWYKLGALNVFVFSKLHYLMRVGSLRMMDLYSLDRDLKTVIKSVCALPTTTPPPHISRDPRAVPA